jgi:hypothetical protein
MIEDDFVDFYNFLKKTAFVTGKKPGKGGLHLKYFIRPN